MLSQNRMRKSKITLLLKSINKFVLQKKKSPSVRVYETNRTTVIYVCFYVHVKITIIS